MALVSLVPNKSGRPVFSFEQFGADPTGVEPATAAIAQAFQYASENDGIVVQNRGVFRMDGSQNIPFSCPYVDLTGSVLKLDGWGGEFQYRQKERPITYDASNESQYGVLALVNSSSAVSRQAGSSRLDGLENSTILNNNYVIIKTPQPMFQYRDGDGVLTRADYNRVYQKGTLEDSFKYGLGNNVTSVYALPIQRFVSELKGFCFDMTNATRYRVMLVEDSTRLRCTGWSIKNKPVTTTRDFYFVEHQRCYDVVVEDFDDPYATIALKPDTGESKASYCFSMTDCMNMLYKNCTANGNGWGSTGNNNCSKVEFSRCKLSRIDFHQPYRTFLKVTDCELGRDGIVVSGYGDLIVTRTQFNYRTDQVGTTTLIGNMISTRGDAGGFVDGALIMRDISMNGMLEPYSNIRAMIHGYSDGLSRGPVAGSPVTPTLFTRIDIDGLTVQNKGLANHYQYLIQCSRAGALMFPKEITLRNVDLNFVKSSGVGCVIPMGNFKANPDSTVQAGSNAMSTPFTHSISVDGMNTTHFTVSGSSALHNPYVQLRNVKNLNFAESATLMEFAQRGTFELFGCEVEGFDFASGDTANGSVYVQMNGGKLRVPAGSNACITGISGNSVGTDIRLNGVDIIGAFPASPDWALSKNLVQYCSLNRCRVYNSDGSPLLGVQVWSGQTTGTNLNPGIRIRGGSTMLVGTGYTSNGTYALSQAIAPHGAGRAWMYLGGTDAAGLVFSAGIAGAADLTSIASAAGKEIVGVYVQ